MLSRKQVLGFNLAQDNEQLKKNLQPKMVVTAGGGVAANSEIKSDVRGRNEKIPFH